MKKLEPKIIFLLLPFILLFACKTTYLVQEQKTSNYEINQDFKGDAGIESMIAPYREKLDAEMNQVIGYLETELTKDRPESTLGNFVADAILEVAQKRYDQPIDFSLPNYGGLRIPYLNAGEVVLGDMFELMPFDNMLVIAQIDGKIAQQLFEHIADLRGWPVSSGVQMSIDTLQQQHSFLINGEPIDPNKTYRFCVSDYIANGGDKCSFLIDQKRDDLNLLFRDALIEYVQSKKKEKMAFQLEGRAVYK